MLSIELNGFETPGMLRAVMSALRAYVDEATEEYILTRGQPCIGAAVEQMPPPPQEPAIDAPAAAAAGVAAEVMPAEKPRRKRAPAAEEVRTEPAETATADQSAVIAQAKAAIAEEGKPAAEVKIEDIRAIARLFNTDELREVALAILAKHDAASVTALAERDNIIRVSALADFQAAAMQYNLA
jgi:hypothetical protein